MLTYWPVYQHDRATRRARIKESLPTDAETVYTCTLDLCVFRGVLLDIDLESEERLAALRRKCQPPDRDRERVSRSFNRGKSQPTRSIETCYTLTLALSIPLDLFGGSSMNS